MRQDSTDVRAAIAIPAAMAVPCPSAPVFASTPGSFFMSGWPGKTVPNAP